MSDVGRTTPAPEAPGGDRPERPGASGAGDGRADGDAPDRQLPPACVPEPDGSCSICGDEGRVGEVVEVAAGAGRGRVRWDDDGRTARVSLDLVAGVEVGDRVVVHMGFAIGRFREREGDGDGGRPGGRRGGEGDGPLVGEQGGTP